MRWSELVSVGCERLNHLRFPDGVTFIANNANGIDEMLQKFNARGKEVGPVSKTKVKEGFGRPNANFRMDSFIFKKSTSVSYLIRESNMGHSLQLEIAQKAAGWRKFYTSIVALKASSSKNRASSLVMKVMTYE